MNLREGKDYIFNLFRLILIYVIYVNINVICVLSLHEKDTKMSENLEVLRNLENLGKSQGGMVKIEVDEEQEKPLDFELKNKFSKIIFLKILNCFFF